MNNSMKSRRYRQLGKTSQVDECLFGSTAPATQKKQEVTVIGKDSVMLRKKNRGNSESSNSRSSPTSAVVIAASELLRMQKEAAPTSRKSSSSGASGGGCSRRASFDEEKQARIRAHKEKLLSLEDERRKKCLVTATDRDQIQNARVVVDRAQEQLDEDLPEIKRMNQILLYNQVATIRQNQMKEKDEIKKERDVAERELDQMMEDERKNAMKVYEDREKAKIHQQRNGAQVIIHQIRENQKSRIREEELRDREREFMAGAVAEMKVEEEREGIVKAAAARVLLEEVNRVNEASLKEKQEQARLERLDDERIANHLKERERRELELEAAKIEAAAEKEKEIARLRALQEQVADKSAEMDSLRAKRAREAAERVARARDAQDAARLKKINEEMNGARQTQQAEKLQRVEQIAIQEQEDFEHTKAMQDRQAELDHQAAERTNCVMKEHNAQLRSQIAVGEEKKLQEKRNAYEEQHKTKAKLDIERKRLDAIKQRKLEQLAKSGAPEKLLADLESLKLSV